MPPIFGTDQTLWYKVNVWGELGYAVPNFGDDPYTVNSTIAHLTTVIGRNLSAVMHTVDADSRQPPKINTIERIHKLIIRARSILTSRMVPSNQREFESVHSSPAPEDFIIFPVPYFKVRNAWMKEYCGLVLNALSEAFQHSENRRPHEISVEFAGLIGQYLHRVYRRMAVELLQVAPEAAAKLDFTLTDLQLNAYEPSKFFTSTEMIDTVPDLNYLRTEDDIKPITDGIPARLLAGLARWPGGEPFNPATGGKNNNGSSSSSGGSGESSAPNTGAFPPAPTP